MKQVQTHFVEFKLSLKKIFKQIKNNNQSGYDIVYIYSKQFVLCVHNYFIFILFFF